jgi:hypothetical protein
MVFSNIDETKKSGQILIKYAVWFTSYRNNFELKLGYKKGSIFRNKKV